MGHIVGVCSARNIDFVKKLGADNVCDYTKGPIENSLDREFDVVFDVVGGENSYKSAKSILGKNGKFITATGPIEWIGYKKLSIVDQLSFIFKMVWGSIQNY